MRRQLAHSTKIVRGIDQAPAEVILPDAIDNRTPSQWIVSASDPLRERHTTFSFRMLFGQWKSPIQSGNDRNRARTHGSRWRLHIATLENADFTWLAVVLSSAGERTTTSMNTSTIHELRGG